MKVYDNLLPICIKSSISDVKKPSDMDNCSAHRKDSRCNKFKIVCQRHVTGIITNVVIGFKLCTSPEFEASLSDALQRDGNGNISDIALCMHHSLIVNAVLIYRLKAYERKTITMTTLYFD